MRGGEEGPGAPGGSGEEPQGLGGRRSDDVEEGLRGGGEGTVECGCELVVGGGGGGVE